jgi:Outer membrane efflux protein
MRTPNPLINRENHMTVHDKKIQQRRTHALPTLTILTAALFLAGCTVTPKMATQEEVRERVKTDTERMYVNQSPISGPVSLEEAIARTLKYNLDYRLKKMESALALGLTDYASYETLPRLLANAGYRTRSTQSGGTSVGILDGVQSLRPSTSEERSHSLAGAEFSWNLLDFGVSYYRARQQSDQFLIAEERRPIGGHWVHSVCRRRPKTFLIAPSSHWRVPAKPKRSASYLRCRR